jgi:hypothetical protein
MYGESVIASEAKQSRENLGGRNQFAQLDCFVAEPVIGPATSGRTRWLLAMTNLNPSSMESMRAGVDDLPLVSMP